jgi:transposase
LHCVLLAGQGLSCYEVATLFGENPRTIERWVKEAERFGAERLKERKRGGRRPALERNALEALRQSLPGGATWTGRSLQSHLDRTYAVHLSIRQCQRLLKELRALRNS